MKTPKILQILSDLDEDLILEADNYEPKHNKSRFPLTIMLICLVLVVVAIFNLN